MNCKHHLISLLLILFVFVSILPRINRVKANVLPPINSQGAATGDTAPSAAQTFLPYITTPNPITPTIKFFTMTPERLMPDDTTVTLSWETDAEHVYLLATDWHGGVDIGQSIPDTPIGSVTIEAPEGLRIADYFTAFYLGAYNINDAGERVWIQEIIQVYCRPEAWFFDNPPDRCPIAAPVEVPMAIQQFEHGVMHWREDQDTIRLLVRTEFDTKWKMVQNEWDSSQPEDSHPDLTAPDGLFKPIRGFGVAWSDQLFDPTAIPAYTVQELLGWATSAEIGYTGRTQCTNSFYTSCYYEAPDDVIYVLNAWGSAWGIYSETTP